MIVLPAPAVAGPERPETARSGPIWMNPKRVLLSSFVSANAFGPSAFANRVYVPGVRGSGRVIDVVPVLEVPTPNAGTVLVPTIGTLVSRSELRDSCNDVAEDAACPLPELLALSVPCIRSPAAPCAGTVRLETVRSGATSSLTIVTVPDDGVPIM